MENKVKIERQKVNIPGLIILTLITLIATTIGIIFFINSNNNDLATKILFFCTFFNIIPIAGWKYIIDNKTKVKYLLLNRIEDHCYEFIDEDGSIQYIPFKENKNELEIQKIYKITINLKEYIIEPIDDNTLTQEEIMNLNNQIKTTEEMEFENKIKDIQQAKESVSIFKIFMTIAYIIGGIIITKIIINHIPEQKYDKTIYIEILIISLASIITIWEISKTWQKDKNGQINAFWNTIENITSRICFSLLALFLGAMGYILIKLYMETQSKFILIVGIFLLILCLFIIIKNILKIEVLKSRGDQDE